MKVKNTHVIVQKERKEKEGGGANTSALTRLHTSCFSTCKNKSKQKP